jgi:hypothetical protein
VLGNERLSSGGIFVAWVTIFPLFVMLDESGGQGEHGQQQDLRDPTLKLVECRSPCSRDSPSILAQLKEKGLPVHHGEVWMDMGPVGTAMNSP